MKRKLRIAMALPSGIALGERLYQGIADYARKNGRWSFTQIPEMMSSSIYWLRDWPGDGAFAFITTPEENRFVRSLPIPVVNLSSHISKPSVATITTDNHAIGRLAAEHLLSKRFRHLAFYGSRGQYFSEERFRGFYEVASKRARVDRLMLTLPSATPFRWKNQEAELDNWLKRLKTPVGIFAATDPRASLILGACERLGLRVPQDVAVLGVDNDPLICELSQPSLSSVTRNDIEVGRRAAALLEALIRGKKNPGWLLIPPGEIVQRASTTTLAVEDSFIADAIEHIQRSLDKPFGTEEIAAMLPISRRSFEMRFRHAVGCSPYTFINQLRVDRAKCLLEQTSSKLSLTHIAAACGFSSPRRFRLVFQRITGRLPSTWHVTST